MENEPGRRSPSAAASAKISVHQDRSERFGRSGSSSSDTSSEGLDSGRRRNHIEGEIPVSSMPGTTTTGDIPPVQVMERRGESGSPGTYKFPSSVFDRTKSPSSSPNPMEWSTASNESLFSIHMGDTSFNKEMYWLDQSVDPITPDASHSPIHKTTPRNADLRRVDDDDRTVATRLQTGAVSDSRNEEGVRSPWEGLNLSTSPSPRRSDASGASVKSFAFPILTGDDRGSSKKSAQGSTKPRTLFNKTQPETQTPRVDPPNPKPVQETQQGGCFSCLGWGRCLCRGWCCRYCS